MKLKWIEDKNTKGKCCIELDEEFNIHLAIFKCTKGNLVGQCNPNNNDYHWVGTVGIRMGPGIKFEGHSISEEQAIEDIEKMVIHLLKWRKEYWEEQSDSIYNHIQNINKRIAAME
jgi:hypothetical protein